MGGIVSVLQSGERLLRLNLVAKQTENFMQNIMQNWKIFSALWTGFLWWSEENKINEPARIRITS